MTRVYWLYRLSHVAGFSDGEDESSVCFNRFSSGILQGDTGAVLIGILHGSLGTQHCQMSGYLCIRGLIYSSTFHFLNPVHTAKRDNGVRLMAATKALDIAL